jgi:hypothetical protein
MALAGIKQYGQQVFGKSGVVVHGVPASGIS